jgi:hypothetical protein
MKVSILHPDPVARTIIRGFFENLEHVIVHEAPDLSEVPLGIVRHRPHLVVAAEISSKSRIMIEMDLTYFALQIPILWLPFDLIGLGLEPVLATLLSSLLSGLQRPTLTRYADEYRNVLRDREYEAHEHGKKVNLPPFPSSPNDDLDDEIVKFSMQVRRATAYHGAARRYLRQVLSTEKGLGAEIAYRATHSSFKIYWLREHIFRWIGVLAHYLPGVEPTYLPQPAPPSPKLDFLFYEPPPESLYAEAALINFGLKPSWVPALKSVVDFKFSGQDEEALLRDTLFLGGWSFLLRQIAISQVKVMESALQPTESWYADGLPPRSLHRATGVFCDFWHLRNLRENPEHLRRVADAAAVDCGTVPDGMPVVPPFRSYIGRDP